MSLQEKFQIITPPNNNEDCGENEWVWPVKGNPKVTDCDAPSRMHVNNATSVEIADGKFNFLPPGMDIGNQARARIPHSQFQISGATDISGDVNVGAFAEGFTRRQMKGADDIYSGEHIDHFYGEAIGDDGNEGFVERNNYLDRI